MTEKRFVDYFDKDHNYIIQDLQNEDEYQVGFVNCDEDVFLELVNKIAKENEQLKSKNRGLQSELQIFKEDVTHSNLQINKLADENEQLKSIKKFADRNGICIFNIDEAFRRCWNDNAKLVKENEQLRKDATTLVYSNQDYRKENEQLKADKQALIDFIRKEFPKSHKHILEGFE